MEAVSFLVAAGALVVIWAVISLIGGSWNVLRFIQGEDHRPSTSKAQWLLWTIVILFSYVAIYAARAQRGHFEALGEVPANVLVALGLTTATMAVAKGIAMSKRQPPATAATLGISDLRFLVQENDGSPDLSKAQMLAWTFVALSVYVLVVVNQVHGIVHDVPGSIGIPDIDGSLMALMGLGQGGYIAKKVVSPS